jgi:hypothetical protein
MLLLMLYPEPHGLGMQPNQVLGSACAVLPDGKVIALRTVESRWAGSMHGRVKGR